MLPYWWLREDKAFCEAVNGPFRKRDEGERARIRAIEETDEQRIARRKAEYFGTADPRGADEQALDRIRAGLDPH